MDPAVQNGYDGPVTIVGATYEQFATEGETKASFNENGKFGWETAESAKFEITNGWYESTAQDISADKSKCSFQIVGDLSTDMVAVLPADINPARYDAQSTNDGLKVTIPASRTWVKDQSYATMLGFGANNGGNTSYSFSHLGGLAKIKVNGVPANATKFVFKTKGFKISGEFEAGKINTNGGQTISTAAASSAATSVDDFTEDEETYTLTFASNDISSNGGVMEFNVPLPCGTYSNGFAFCFKNESGGVIYSFVGSSPQTVGRTDRLCLPTINIVGGGGENLPTKSVQNIPAGYKGDFLLAEAENVLLKIAPETNANDINLKYNSGQKPSNLEINIVDGETAGTFAGTISGILPDTHVDFTKGTIANVSMTTSTSTFEIIYPATISTKLTVTGGNVTLMGAKVAAIEVAQGATADGGSTPVMITLADYTPAVTEEEPTPVAQTPEVVAPIVANANVTIDPAKDVEVFVEKGENVEVTTASGQDKGDVITIGEDAVVMIGSTPYTSLTDAITAVAEGETIKILKNIDDAKGITVGGGKNFTVDFGGKTYTCASDPAGSNGTKNQVFQLLETSTITFKNGTINVADANKDKFRFIIQNYANLTLEDMVLDGSNLSFVRQDGKPRYTVSNNQGPVKFTGKTDIIAATENGVAFDVCKYATYTEPEVTWDSEGSVTGTIELTGGEFLVAKDLTVNAPILCSAESELTFNAGKTLQGQNFSTTKNSKGYTENNTGVVIVKNGGDLTIKGAGTIKSNAVSAAIVMTEKGDDATNAAKLTVNDATLIGKNFGISGNGTRPNTVIIINSGTIKGTETNDCAGIYHPQSGSLAINGGKIEGAVGIYVKSGTVTTSINAGEITGTGISKPYEPQNGSFVATGDAIVFDNCDYPGGAPNATINGGTFTSKNGLAVASYAKEGVEGGPIKPVINGGTFSDESAIKYAAKDANITIKLQADRTAGTGVFVNADQNQTITFDLNGHNFVGVAPAVGSKGTENQLFHIEKNNTFTLKNSDSNQGGTVSIASENANLFRFIIQNYANLTLENVTIDGTGLSYNADDKGYTYALSNNCGIVYLNGTTSIKASTTSELNNYAFDVCKYSNYDAPTVTWNSTGSVTGNIELTGGKLVIASNLDYANTILATAGTSNLEVNATLSATDASDWYLVKAGSNGKSGVILNISGTGTLSSGTSVHCIPVTSDYGAQVNISGGNYICYGVNTNTPDGGECVYANREGKVSILGGEFSVRKGDTVKDLLNVQNDQKATDIQCTGGTFYGKNPADGDDAIGSSFVAEGYEAKETSTGVWTVSAKQN